jgi:beta-1,4-mannosyl-glycoprotein beta-1,4-N-acetylglucosaminyltransferase
MVVFDVWNFNGEPIAAARIRYLAPYVNRFVVVEGAYTFSGRKKDRLFIEDAPFRNDPNVEVVVVPDYVSGGAWANETHQRNAGGEAFIRLGSLDDFGIFSDADEVPGADFFPTLLHPQSPSALWYAQNFFYYNFNWQKTSLWPPHGFGIRHAAARSTTTQRLRTHGQKNYVKSGWHASYFETPERIADKIRSFSHTELNTPEFTDVEKIRARIADGKDLFNRPGEDCVPSTVTLPLAMVEFNEALVKAQRGG